MAWRLDGTYFENCSCEVGCPCTVADFSAPADHDRCRFLMAFHVDTGKVDDVDVSGLTVGVFGDTPAMLGMESATIEYRNDGRRHSVKIGDAIAIDVDDVASPLDPTAAAPMLTGVHHPASSTLTVARAGASRISAFGYELALEGKSGFSAPFTWAG
jgi:hypothetical protein